ncbi:FecR domain-containing protein [Runella sp. MFBS21]|uniref:FecR family protein n=1 Tax=Runella sp. MFBS21 TaxID=3034018 RepID=UPI0023F6C44E|nr:FecR family protein [Runella sp. MFBS21]MDF7819870.1 FecR domain-containing protein [Runella sp. MFBS21]
MNYPHHSASDFMEDTHFRQWVYQPDADSDSFWEEYQQKYPEKKQELAIARQLLLNLQQQVQSGFSTKAVEDAVFQNIQQELETKPIVSTQLFPHWVRWAAAAAVVLLGITWVFWSQKPTHYLSYEINRQQSQNTLVEKSNLTSKPFVVSLADGSSVLLSPQSKISYCEDFDTHDKREVFLSGEAFFEVAKNAQKPFYVYANELVTKVLGTSFNVRAFPEDKNVVVKVHTGRVAVAVADKIADKQKITARELDGIVLLPNQQAVLSRDEFRLVKSLVENPSLLSSNTPISLSHSFEFESARASDVFKAVEEAYGIDIVFDEEVFANCLFTANLTDEPLYEKLNIICKSIEASYQILDAQIIISGKGCHL